LQNFHDKDLRLIFFVDKVGSSCYTEVK
jgi:hypothetical protein